ncbi:MAG: T9SS type A sorting domain-containing protein [Bacteroidales bacterium]|nr:T9SS type A sorting domain-containing protein [Bacteroidales bacterium]
MKKVILFFSVLFLSGMVVFGQPTATLGLPDVLDPPAGPVFTDLTVDAIAGGENFGTFQIFIVYDPLVLTPVDVTYPNPNFPFYEWSNNLLYGPDEIILTWLSFSGGYTPTVGEVLCTIEWLYVGAPSFSLLTFNTVGDEVAGWPEKGMTAVWTSFGVQYILDYNPGYVGPGGPPLTTWTGAFDENWDDPLNWTAGVPDDMTDAEIPDVSKAPFPTIYGSAATGFLTIFPGAQLNVAPNADLTTFGLFTNDGLFVVETGPNPGWAGSFIDLGGLAGGGMFDFTRNMFCTGTVAGSTSPFGWHFVSAPIDGFTTHDMFDYYANAWNETTGSWIHLEGGTPPPDCVPFPMIPSMVLLAASINYALDYACGATNPGTGLDLEFIGPHVGIHTGPYSAAATFTPGPFAGWNMFGNPYPSGLDMNAIVWDPAAIPGAAYYDGCAGNYVYWTPALGMYSMAPSLGFFTEYTATGNFSLTGAERTHAPDWFWKSEVSDLLTLQITGDETSDITHIRFMEEAEAGFAKDGDFHKLFSVGIPQMYTTAGADKLAINALPATASVPMGFTSTETGSYTISAIETSEFSHVVLEDLVTGIQTDLLTGSYTFEYATGEDEARFIVHFTPLGIGDNFADLVNIWSSANNIYVKVPEVTGDIVVFNMMGQEVVRTDIEPGTTVIPMNDVNTYYVVKVLTSDNVATGKVFIK